MDFIPFKKRCSEELSKVIPDEINNICSDDMDFAVEMSRYQLVKSRIPCAEQLQVTGVSCNRAMPHTDPSYEPYTGLLVIESHEHKLHVWESQNVNASENNLKHNRKFSCILKRGDILVLPVHYVHALEVPKKNVNKMFHAVCLEFSDKISLNELEKSLINHCDPAIRIPEYLGISKK